MAKKDPIPEIVKAIAYYDEQIARGEFLLKDDPYKLSRLMTRMCIGLCRWMLNLHVRELANIIAERDGRF